MKKISKTFLALGAVLALAGCNSKCTFAEFKEAANAVGNHGFNSAEVKTNDKSYTLTYSTTTKLFISTDIAAVSYVSLINTFTVKSVAVSEIEGATYYKGSGFALSVTDKNDDGSSLSRNYEWNDKGLLTKYDIKSTSSDSTGNVYFTVSYK